MPVLTTGSANHPVDIETADYPFYQWVITCPNYTTNNWNDPAVVGHSAIFPFTRLTVVGDTLHSGMFVGVSNSGGGFMVQAKDTFRASVLASDGDNWQVEHLQFSGSVGNNGGVHITNIQSFERLHPNRPMKLTLFGIKAGL